jgi:hypothetical protein
MMKSTLNSFAKADSFRSLQEAISGKDSLDEASYRASIRNPTCTSNRTFNWMLHRNWNCDGNSVLGCFTAQDPGISALIAPASCTVGATLQRLSCYHSLTFAQPNDGRSSKWRPARGSYLFTHTQFGTLLWLILQFFLRWVTDVALFVLTTGNPKAHRKT